MAARTTSSTKVTRVRHVAHPSGRNRDNPPNLGDLRQFVTAAEGLPDELHVFISNGHVGESGRHDTTFTVNYTHPVPEDSDGTD